MPTFDEQEWLDGRGLHPREARVLIEEFRKSKASGMTVDDWLKARSQAMKDDVPPPPHPREMSPPAQKHDAHYREIEAMGVEPIAVAESIIVAGIPPEYHETVRRNYSAALAVKYLMRLGHKDDGKKELDKSANYIHRARTGTWM
ncbi:MAG: DUF3310 domain-containing protein [Rhizobiales bacterium]|nr:DUF3310 domain-containing protein [Hyphomicrobiales bacterium]